MEPLNRGRRIAGAIARGWERREERHRKPPRSPKPPAWSSDSTLASTLRWDNSTPLGFSRHPGRGECHTGVSMINSGCVAIQTGYPELRRIRHKDQNTFKEGLERFRVLINDR